VTAVHADGILQEQSSGVRSSAAFRPPVLRQWENQRMLSSFVACLLATLHKNFQRHLREIVREGWQWANKQMTKFRCRSRSFWIQGLFSGFITIRRFGKWLTDINLLLIQICQMVALMRDVPWWRY